MKPGEHPEFFRFPAPEGRSRESSIVLRADGHFEHDGERVAHAKLEQAMHTWISRHPDDGRYILTNGYDWTYFAVEDAPFFVRHLSPPPPADDAGSPATPIIMVLSDGSEEPLDATRFTEGEGGALYTLVKHAAKGGPYEAKLTRHAQTSLASFLRTERVDPAEDKETLMLGNERFLPKPRDNKQKK